MKLPFLKHLVALVGLLVLCLTLVFLLQPAAARHNTLEGLASVSVLELPQTAARMVSQAAPVNRAQVTREVLDRVSTLAQPGMTAFAVGAIIRATPDMTVEAVRAAVSLQPAEALPIARAALSAAPEQTEVVVGTICEQVPQSYAWLAVIAAEANPAARAQILRAIATAVPVLAVPLQQAEVATGNRPMVELIQKTHELATAAYRDRASEQKRQLMAAALQQHQSRSPAAESKASAGAGGSPSHASLAGQTTAMEEIRNLNSRSRNLLAALDQEADRALRANRAGGVTEMAYLESSAGLQDDGSAGQHAAFQTYSAPHFGLPFTPYGGSYLEVSASDGTVASPGTGRDYSAP